MIVMQRRLVVTAKHLPVTCVGRPARYRDGPETETSRSRDGLETCLRSRLGLVSEKLSTSRSRLGLVTQGLGSRLGLGHLGLGPKTIFWLFFREKRVFCLPVA